MALKPWERYGQAGATPGPIVAPVDPYKQAAEVRAENAQANTQADRAADNARADRALALQEETARLQAEVRNAELTKSSRESNSRVTALRSLENQINRVQTLYRENVQGFNGNIPALGVAAPTEANQQFDTAGAALSQQGLAAFRVPGTGTVSDRDAMMFDRANLPSADKYDLAIEEQLIGLRARVEQEYAALGLPAPEWQGMDEPKAAANTIEGYDEKQGLLPTVTDDSPLSPGGGPTGGSSGWSEIGKGAGSVIEGAASLPGLVINPIGQALYDALGYDATYNTGDILRNAVGLPDNSGVGDAVIQGAAGALTGGGAARAASSIAAPGAIRNALELVGRTPIRDTAAGAAAGAGMAAGDRLGGPVGGAVGALAGGVAGYGAANALTGVAAPRALSSLGAAAQRQGVDILPADAGGAVARGVTGAARQSPLSASPIARAAGRQQDQMRAATRRAADSQGNVTDTQLAGEGVRDAAQRYTRETSARGDRLYTRAGERARGVRIKPLQTLANLDAQIARVQENPAATPAMVDELTRFRDNIANGVGVTGLRDARTTLSQGTYDGNLRSGPEKAMWKSILNDLSTDIDSGLRQAGRGDAARMFRQADAFWKGRVEHIDEVLQPFLGKDRGGEEIVAAVERMARGQGGGNARLSRLLGAMTPEEAGNIRAVVIDRIGRANPGAQNAEGNAFSAATFLTNWNKMTPQARASLFNDEGLRRNLTDIAQIAEGTKVGQSAANHSNTAGAIAGNIGAGAALAYANPVAALIGAGGQYLTGRLMASPSFARLLARTAKMPDGQAQRTFAENLGTIAGREPILANDIRSVQQYLSEAFAQSPGRLAAREDESNSRPEPPQ
jgi:hypothetical protein